MRVIETKPVLKDGYEYITVNFNETNFAGWELGHMADIPSIEIDKHGNIFISLKRKVK